MPEAASPAPPAPPALTVPRSAPGLADRRFSLLRSGLVGLGLALLPAQFLPGVNASYVVVVAIACLCAALIARAEDPADRLTSFTLFAWAMLLRVVAVTAAYALGVREGGPFLGPDSTTYYQMSADLAASGFHVAAHPVVVFGSYDLAQYYFFAGAMKGLGADLFGLQMLNCGLTALAAPLLFGFARSVVPRWALWLGLAVAVHPSLVALSAVDLLKDPSIIFATLLLVWILLKLTRERAPGVILLLSGAGIVAAVYLHTGRFYTFAYLELAFIAALVIMRLMRLAVFARTLALVAAASIFLAGEILPMRAAWLPSPVMVASSVSYVLGTPAMSQYAMGLFDRLAMSSAPGVKPRVTERGPMLEPVHLSAREVGSAAAAYVLSSAANLFRRLYGPFVWILPRDWHFRTLQAGDYLLYPGMLVWYGLIPFIVAGLASTARRIVTRAEPRFGIVLLWVFSAVYFAQYLMINLSYRQRDVMLPVLIVFACIGIASMTPYAKWRRWYAGYGVMLALIAAAHLVARAILRA